MAYGRCRAWGRETHRPNSNTNPTKPMPSQTTLALNGGTCTTGLDYFKDCLNSSIIAVSETPDLTKLGGSRHT